jgi:hypothetical protein
MFPHFATRQRHYHRAVGQPVSSGTVVRLNQKIYRYIEARRRQVITRSYPCLYRATYATCTRAVRLR